MQSWASALDGQSKPFQVWVVFHDNSLVSSEQSVEKMEMKEERGFECKHFGTAPVNSMNNVRSGDKTD